MFVFIEYTVRVFYHHNGVVHDNTKPQKKGKKKAPKEEFSEKHILDKYYTAGNKGADNQEKKKKNQNFMR